MSDSGYAIVTTTKHFEGWNESDMSDFNSTRGLCGLFDGIGHNDLNNVPEEDFIEEWRYKVRKDHRLGDAL